MVFLLLPGHIQQKASTITNFHSFNQNIQTLKVTAYILLVPLLLFTACRWPEEPDNLLKKYGKKFDPVRKKVGLFPISGRIKENSSAPEKEKAYIIHYNLTGHEYNDSCKIRAVQQYIRNDSLLEECDHIYGRYMDHTLDGNYREEMDYDYYFYDCTIDYKFHKKGWECTVSDSKQFGFSAEITKRIADSLLSAWDIRPIEKDRK